VKSRENIRRHDITAREEKNVTYSASLEVLEGVSSGTTLPAYVIACIHIYARRWKRVKKVDDGGGRTRLS